MTKQRSHDKTKKSITASTPPAKVSPPASTPPPEPTTWRTIFFCIFCLILKLHLCDPCLATDFVHVVRDFPQALHSIVTNLRKEHALEESHFSLYILCAICTNVLYLHHHPKNLPTHLSPHVQLLLQVSQLLNNLPAFYSQDSGHLILHHLQVVHELYMFDP